MKTQKFCLIILFCLFFSSLALADEWTIVGQLNIGREAEFQSALLTDGADHVGAHKTASIPQRSVAGVGALQRGTPKLNPTFYF